MTTQKFNIPRTVLIETYWNVKKECINYMYTVEVSIETYWNVKLRGAYTNVLTDSVLIETYWNVKLRGAYTNVRTDSVLIETYWNVKDDSFCASEWHLGINRNILECKV